MRQQNHGMIDNAIRMVRATFEWGGLVWIAWSQWGKSGEHDDDAYWPQFDPKSLPRDHSHRFPLRRIHTTVNWNISHLCSAKANDTVETILRPKPYIWLVLLIVARWSNYPKRCSPNQMCNLVLSHSFYHSLSINIQFICSLVHFLIHNLNTSSHAYPLVQLQIVTQLEHAKLPLHRGE